MNLPPPAAPPCIEGRDGHEWISMHPEWAAIQRGDGRTYRETACPHCLTWKEESWYLATSHPHIEYGDYGLDSVADLPPLAAARAERGLPIYAPGACERIPVIGSV